MVIESLGTVEGVDNSGGTVESGERLHRTREAIARDLDLAGQLLVGIREVELISTLVGYRESTLGDGSKDLLATFLAGIDTLAYHSAMRGAQGTSFDSGPFAALKWTSGLGVPEGAPYTAVSLSEYITAARALLYDPSVDGPLGVRGGPASLGVSQPDSTRALAAVNIGQSQLEMAADLAGVVGCPRPP